MTDHCEDDSDGPDGSFEDLRAEFESAIQDFNERAREDMAKRAEGVAVGARTAAEPGSTTFEPALGVRSKQRPFNPQPVLIAPHYEAGEKRPIPRRSELAPADDQDYLNDWEPNHPLRSDSVTVKRSADGQETDVIKAGEEYTVECTVRNVGGLAARNANVELFVEHLEPNALIDVNEETGFFEATYVYEGHTLWNWNFYLSGVTTMAPGSQLFAQFHTSEESPPVDSYFLGVPIEAGTDNEWYDRSFFETGPSETDYAPEDGEFTVDIWDVSRVVGEVTKDSLEQAGIPLARQAGRIVRDPERYWSRNHELRGDVNLNEDLSDEDQTAGGANRRVGKQSVSIPQNESQTVTFQYTPDGGNFPHGELRNPEVLPPGAGRTVTALYVRAYSLASNELPQTWGELDHTQSRFMARTEVSRLP